MPHDKFGAEVKAGDQVVLRCKVLSVQAHADFCNCTLETVEPLHPGQHKTAVTCNAGQVELAGAPVGLSLDEVKGLAQHAVNLLESHGEHAVNTAVGILRLVRFAAARDMLGVFAQLNQTSVDVKALIAAVRAEFGL